MIIVLFVTKIRHYNRYSTIFGHFFASFSAVNVYFFLIFSALFANITMQRSTCEYKKISEGSLQRTLTSLNYYNYLYR